MAVSTLIPHDGSKSSELGTFPVRCSSLRKNGFVMIKGHPCKIVDMSTSAPGKHGHAKIHLVGFDVFTKKRYEDVHPATHNIDVPEIRKCEMQLVSIGYEGAMAVMDDNGYLQHHLNLPGGPLGTDIREKYDAGDYVMIVVLKALGQEAVHGYKIAKD
ncbi:eukaryotic translation initiation factor 5A-1-like [Liolophura sinensis]|uniref:eukaryotic translation initiation factor 5A-1-like n=1 Tax=Liolophura sinensis TaxID=3198878 RepID=UPI003157F31B